MAIPQYIPKRSAIGSSGSRNCTYTYMFVARVVHRFYRGWPYKVSTVSGLGFGSRDLDLTV